MRGLVLVSPVPLFSLPLRLFLPLLCSARALYASNRLCCSHMFSAFTLCCPEIAAAALLSRFGPPNRRLSSTPSPGPTPPLSPPDEPECALWMCRGRSRLERKRLTAGRGPTVEREREREGHSHTGMKEWIASAALSFSSSPLPPLSFLPSSPCTSLISPRDAAHSTRSSTLQLPPPFFLSVFGAGSVWLKGAGRAARHRLRRLGHCVIACMLPPLAHPRPPPRILLPLPTASLPLKKRQSRVSPFPPLSHTP